MSNLEQQLKEATERIISSSAPKKVVVAGPGAGKTYLFREILRLGDRNPDNCLALTFVNSLKEDLSRSLAPLAKAATLHGFCFGLLKRDRRMRSGLSSDFLCQPGLTSLIKKDWEHVFGDAAPQFVRRMRNLDAGSELDFYWERSSYYDAVEFDDCVYRVYLAWREHPDWVEEKELLLVDEFQDFNRLEAAVVLEMAESSPTVVVGDDDQALYSVLRDATWDAIRELHGESEFETHELPFCMRCTEVIVEAVSDILEQAYASNCLTGRIEKSFRYYPPMKGEDSARYPKIGLIQTSVQSRKVNYFGRYIAQEIAGIPSEEIEEAAEAGDPTVLVIGPRHYTDSIADFLRDQGFSVESRSAAKRRLEEEDGLRLLKNDPESNLGWRIILEHLPDQELAASLVRQTHESEEPLADILSHDLREEVLQRASNFEDAVEDETSDESTDGPTVKVVTFESSKGLSAQHVFLVGMHDGDLPRDPSSIKDLEVCRLLVGLTRAKKKCSLLHTNRYAGTKSKNPSRFLSWIRSTRYAPVFVNAKYWK